MKWYLAKIVFRIVSGAGQHTAQFDEQLRLVKATDEKFAFARARELGMKEAVCFPNKHQELVQWKFVNVSELYTLGELMDGAELYSRIHETTQPDEYISLTNRKAATIRKAHAQGLLELL